jgi:hypothetical protein
MEVNLPRYSYFYNLVTRDLLLAQVSIQFICYFLKDTAVTAFSENLSLVAN